MDVDGEDEWPSGNRHVASSDVIKTLLEIANNRPGTNVAKAIVTYNQSPGLSTLLLVLEEISKNTDFSTDLRLSLSYYMDEFLRHSNCPKIPCRSIIAAAGNVLQYCSKVYGDRVEFLYQVVEHQIEALLIADPKKDETSNGKKDASKPEEPRKRRIKKLTQKEFDPFSYKLEPKKFKMMSEEKRFNRTGFELNKNRNRTVEHMYQDHTPAHLWKFASIADPVNPYEQDEKKNYKVFTYHPEPRYNTLLSDIQFDRLNLLKEYVHRNHVEIICTLNRSMSSKEYLDEYIALENQMLASRNGKKGDLKRLLTLDEDEKDKRARVETENLQKRIRLSKEDSIVDDNKCEIDEKEGLVMDPSMDSALGDSLRTTLLTDTSGVQNDSSDLSLNDSSCLDSTRLDQQPTQSPIEKSQLSLDCSKADESNEQMLQIDSGIGMDEMCDTLPTAQSFDDEGVVLTDLLDEQRLQSLSPKVMVHDILPGVPDKANISVRIDAEMLALSGINERFEEIVDVQRDVHHTIKLNFLHIPEKKLRKSSLFKLSKEYDIFKKARMPTKRQGESKAAPTCKTLRVASPTHSTLSRLDNIASLPLDQMEFDSEQNFRGFRRPTYDSGIDQEETRLANSPADDGIVVDVDIMEDSDEPLSQEIQQVRDSEQTEKDVTSSEVSLGSRALDTTALNVTDPNDCSRDLSITKDSFHCENPTTENITALSDKGSGVNATRIEASTNDIELDDEWDSQSNSSSSNVQENCNSIDAETDAKIIDWHRRLAPTLEAAHARQNFSIRDLNDEIIAKCQMNGGKVSLADVVSDKDPTKLCCYMLSALLLTNQRNIDLQIDKGDKRKPIEMSQFKMKLISTERKTLNPEDDIGNISNTTQCKSQTSANPEQPAKVAKTFQTVNVKTVRLIQPVPKASTRSEDADSGISSLPGSSISTWSSEA